MAGGLLFLMVAAAPSAAAQSGQIASVVADATGGVLRGANVTLTGGPEGRREVPTDEAGGFVFMGLHPGTYTVTVSLGGFDAESVDGVAVRADPVELPVITLQLAAFDDALVVTATRMKEPLREVPMSISVATERRGQSRSRSFT